MSRLPESLREGLLKLGLSDYEARAYVALLLRGPMTAVELSREADVPRSKVYEVLGKLERKGWIGPGEGRPARYSARHPREAIYAWRSIREKEMRKVEEEVLEELEGMVRSVQEREDLIIIVGLDAAIAGMRGIAEKCEEDIYLAIPGESAEGLDDLLEAVRRCGSRKYVLAPAPDVARVLRRKLPGALIRVKGDMFGGGLICGSSGVVLLLGRERGGGQHVAIKADHPGLVALARSYFEHLWSLAEDADDARARNG